MIAAAENPRFCGEIVSRTLSWSRLSVRVFDARESKGALDERA